MAVRDPLGAAVHRDPLTDAAIPDAEAILRHRFRRPELLAEALTHRSAVQAGGALSNERLEFVGDRVLGLVMAEWLAERFPAEPEGYLGRRLAHLVSQPVLAEIAERIGFPALLTVGAGESRSGVRRRASVLADAMEAALGALFLDGGLAPARDFVRRSFADAMQTQADPPKDAKTALQEWAQARGHDLPSYHVETRAGPSHAPEFVIAVSAAGQTGQGRAGSKRAAEQAAAKDLLDRLAR